MSEKLRWGIVGCGSVAHAHVLALRQIPNVEVVACYDVSFAKASDFAEKYGITPHADLDDFFKEDLDVVSVCTPSGSRKEIVLKALRKKIHVITEKPLEVTLDAIDEMIAESERNGVVLSCILQTRFGDSQQKMKQILSEGTIGKVVLAEASVVWFRSQEYYDSSNWRGTWKYDGGGALMNQAIHTIDLLLWYMGEPKLVFGVTKTLARKIEVEDTAAAVVEFHNGAVGVIEATTSVSPGFPRKLVFYGTDGTIELRGEDLYLFDAKNSEGVLISKGETMTTFSNPAGFSPENHRRQLSEFVNAILNGQGTIITAREARRSVEFILNIYRSFRERSVVFFERG